jgi:hypothetical protein
MSTPTEEPECAHQELVDACIELTSTNACHCALDVIRQLGYATKGEKEFNSAMERMRAKMDLGHDTTLAAIVKERVQLVRHWKRIEKYSQASGLMYADEMPNLAREYKDASMRKAECVVKGLEREERRRI